MKPLDATSTTDCVGTVYTWHLVAAQHRQALKGETMTVEGMIAKQTRIERQETAHCASVSFDASAANAFQAYVNGTLGFSQMRFGWMYGTVDAESGAVEAGAYTRSLFSSS